MRILVTGGAGYIGNVVVEELLRRGHEPIVLDTFCWGRDALEPLLDRIFLIEGDCRSSKDVVNALDGIDAVVHLAGVVGEAACLQNPKAHFSTNVESARTLVNCCTDPALDLVRDFLFVSSCSVYGNTHGLYLEVTEDAPPHPLSAYAYAKLRAEQIILDRGKEIPHFHPAVLRLTTAFGWSRRPRLDLVTNRFAYSAYKDHRIMIYGTGGQYRSLVHVQDVATAIADVLEVPRFMRDGQIFHVGAKRNNKTLNEIAEIVQGIVPGTEIEHKEKETDRRDYAINCLKIKNLIGWEPKWSIEDGVTDLIEKLEHLGWDWESGKYRNNSYDYT